jgi:uncharacterized protein (TIGR02391 family)
MPRHVSTPNTQILTADQMKHGIKRLEKLIEKVKAFDVSVITKRWSPEVKALETDIDGTLSSVFGYNTIQYERYKDAGKLDRAVVTAQRQPSSGRGLGSLNAYESQEARRHVTDGKERSTQLLKTAAEWLRDELEAVDAHAVPTAALVLTEQIGIHPKIQSKCGGLYESLAFAEAVEKSFKVVRDRLRELSGYEKGSEAFGKGKLHIRGAAAPNVDADFNEGAKFLMMAIDMFRNEKSHTSNAEISNPMRAHQYLILSSLAMYFLDDAEKAP